MTAKSKAGTRRAGRPRGSLSEDEILAAAVEVAGRDGLDGLSMPTLAKRVGASSMGLYRYFHSKDELLAAMAEHIMREVYGRLPPLGNGSWDYEVAGLMTALHAEMQRTPLFAELCQTKPMEVFYRPDAMPALAGRLDEELRAFQRAGLTPDEALRMRNIFFAFTVGFGLLGLGVQTTGKEPNPEEALELSVAQLDPEEFPILGSVRDVGALISVREADYDAFLRLLISGLQARPRDGSAGPA